MYWRLYFSVVVGVVGGGGGGGGFVVVVVVFAFCLVGFCSFVFVFVCVFFVVFFFFFLGGGVVVFLFFVGEGVVCIVLFVCLFFRWGEAFLKTLSKRTMLTIICTKIRLSFEKGRKPMSRNYAMI